jgi:uncharacterized protein YqgQ
MKTVYDIQQMLKRFGTIIYIGDRLAELEFMEMELKELYRSKFIDVREYQAAMIVLHQAIVDEKKKKR